MKFMIFPLFFLIFNQTVAQEKEIEFIKKGDFPEGVYMTLEDVLSKKPSSIEEVYFKPAEKENNSITFPEKVFFYSAKKNKKLLYPLAVSYKGEMYFQTYNKYVNKKDKGYAPDAYSRFCKVSSYGRFIYFEESMRGNFSKALLGTLNPLTYTINGKIKGIVVDIENKELNMLRDCEDINIFLTEHEISKISCHSANLTIAELRLMIDEINKPYR